MTIESNTPRTGFYIIDNDLIDQYGPIIGPYGIAVYSVIARYADANGKNAFPSYQTIADKSGIGKTKVVKTVDHLVKLGIVKREQRIDKDGDLTSNSYSVTMLGMSRGDIPMSPDDKQVCHDVTQGMSPREQDQDTINNTPSDQDKEGDARADQPTPQSPLPSPPVHQPMLEDLPSGPKTVPKTKGIVTSKFFDPRKLIDGLIPEGEGETPVEVYLEFFEVTRDKGCGLSKPQMKTMVAEITDLDKWRAICKIVSLRSGKAYSMDNMLEIYRNGFREKKEQKRHDHRKQPTTRPEPAHARPDLYERFAWDTTAAAPA